jgi:hypothetical protein
MESVFELRRSDSLVEIPSTLTDGAPEERHLVKYFSFATFLLYVHAIFNYFQVPTNLKSGKADEIQIANSVKRVSSNTISIFYYFAYRLFTASPKFYFQQ